MGDSVIPDAVTAPAVRTAPGVAVPAADAIDRYVLLDRIGEGGMGVVWTAYDRRLDRKVALKLLHDALLGAAHQERLVREARAMARLAHPNVVPVFDAGERDGRAFLTMEYVAGRSLVEWLRVRRAWPEVVEVFRAAARGLAAAHAAGLVHRDVKPGNILLGDDGRVRVADFGVARAEVAAPPAGAIATTTVGPVGSPAYMAPEQLRGERADARCDQFGLCAALFEALAGARPFAGETVEVRLDAIAAGPPALGGDVPAWLAAVVARGLAADPDARFPSMDALAGALGGPPRRRVRAWIVALEVVAVAAVVVVAVTQLRAQAGARAAPAADAIDCDAVAAAAFGATWDPAKRAALTAGFAGAGEAGEGARVSAAIDRHAAGWIAARATSCRATELDHTWPAELGVLAAACLDEQRAGLAALVTGLAAADAAAIANGHDLVVRLPPAGACGDPELLRAQVTPVRDPGRGVDPALEDRVEALTVALNLRRTAEVEAALPALRRDVEAAGDARLVGSVLRIAATFARQRGDAAGATAIGKQAYLYARRHRDVAGAALAASSLVWTLGYFGRDPVAGEDWAALALVELDSAPQVRAAILVHQAIGVFAESRGEGPRSIDHQRQSLALVERYYGPDHYMTARAIELVASALGEGGRPAEAAALYRDALPRIARAFGDPSGVLAHLLAHYAIVAKDAGDDATALAIGARAVEVGRAAGVTGADFGSLLLNHGAVLHEARRYDEAIVQLDAARAAYAEAGEAGLAAKALTNLGAIHGEQAVARDDAALERRAIAELEAAAAALAEAWGADSTDVALTWSSLARLHGLRGRCPRALALADRALAIYAHTPELPDQADPLLVIGRCRLDAGQVDAAVTALARASAAQHAGGNDPQIAAELDGWLALALRRDGQLDRARTLAAEARPILAAAGETYADLLARLDRALAAP